MYRPNDVFNVPFLLLIPTETKVEGVPQKTYPALADGILFYGSFKTFGGTETNSNGLLIIKDTATIETWYMPEIKANCKIALADTGELYDIIGTPEDISARHQYLRFKVERVKGGA